VKNSNFQVTFGYSENIWHYFLGSCALFLEPCIYNTRGSQKVPGNVVYQCNGWTYDNAYLITFKVGPLLTHTHTLAPSILPLLEPPAEGFFWNFQQFGRCISFDILHGREMRPLEAHFQSREQPKVTRSEIRRLRWLGDDRNAFLGEELLHNKRCVTRCEHTEPHITFCAAIPHQEKLSCHHPTTVISGSCSK